MAVATLRLNSVFRMTHSAGIPEWQAGSSRSNRRRIVPAGVAAECIEWTGHRQPMCIGDVGIDHGGVDVCMPQQQLDPANVAAAEEQVGGKAVPERVRCHALDDSGFSRRVADRFLERAQVEVRHETAHGRETRIAR